MATGNLTRIEMDYMNSVCSINRKMKDQKEIDWEQRRYEIAKEMLAAFMSNSCSEVYDYEMERQAREAVAYADALIAELKKGGNNGKVG